MTEATKPAIQICAIYIWSPTTFQLYSFNLDIVFCLTDDYLKLVSTKKKLKKYNKLNAFFYIFYLFIKNGYKVMETMITNLRKRINGRKNMIFVTWKCLVIF